MSWFKRRNEALNEEGAAQVAPNSHHMNLDEAIEEYRSQPGPPVVWSRPDGSAPRMNDSERLGYDAVNLPDHYKKFKIEPIRFCQENGLDANQTGIIKYVTRFRDKNGTEDLKKAARMLDMLIAFEEGDPDWWRLPGERASRRTYIV